MAIDYSPYSDLLWFIGNKVPSAGALDFDGSYSAAEVTPNVVLNTSWDPSGLFDLNGGNVNSPGSYNPYFSTEVRDMARKIAAGLGLKSEDADRAALDVAQNVLRAQGGTELYSEATSPYIILDRIAANLYGKAGKPYQMMTPEQQAHYANLAQDFQTQVKSSRSDFENSQDLSDFLGAMSVPAAAGLGALFGPAAEAGSGAATAGAEAPTVAATSGAGATGMPSWAGEALPTVGGLGGLGAETGTGILSGVPTGVATTGTGTLAEQLGQLGLNQAGANGLETLGLAGPGTATLGSSGLTTGLGAGVAGAAGASLLGGSGTETQGATETTGGGLLEGLLGGSLAAGAGGINLGQLLGAGLGFAGSYEQTQALKDLAEKQMAMGAPYRDKLQQLYTPEGINTWMHGADVTTPVQMGTDALARSLSVKGNPFGSGTSLQSLQDYATQQLYGQLGNERNRLANYGGLSAFNAAAPGTATNAIESSGGMYNAAGYAANSLFPQQNQYMQNIYKQLGLA